MVTRRAKRWLRWAATITVSVVVVGLLAAVWFQSQQIEDDLLKVDPRELAYDVPVLAVSGSTVTLARTAESARQGRWGLEWEMGYAEVGAVVRSNAFTVTRELGRVAGVLRQGTSVAVDRFAFESDPGDVGLEYESVIVEGALGNYPAWRLPGEDDTWVLLVHGRGSNRREALRALPAIAAAGFPALVISYRNDPEAPPSPHRHYGLGESEWPDLEAAVLYALEEGGRDVVLVGFGSGAGVASLFLRESEHGERVVGLVFDAPLLDPSAVIAAKGRSANVPGFIVAWGRALATLRFGTDWRALNQVRHAEDFEERDVPILVFHGDRDGEAPIGPSDAFAEALPDLVSYERIEGAGHAEAWNVDRVRYEQVLAAFLAEVAAAPSSLRPYVAEEA
jgi:pimeloyl-ACP methyl ester carboxylesterase